MYYHAKWQGVACASCSPGPRDVRPPRGTTGYGGSAGDVIPATRRAACRLPRRAARSASGPARHALFDTPRRWSRPRACCRAAIMRAVCGAIRRDRCAAGCSSAVVFTGQSRQIRHRLAISRACLVQPASHQSGNNLGLLCCLVYRWLVAIRPPA